MFLTATVQLLNKYSCHLVTLDYGVACTSSNAAAADFLIKIKFSSASVTAAS